MDDRSFCEGLIAQSRFLPPAGEIKDAADDKGHEARERVAHPEAEAVEPEDEAEQGGEAHAADHAVDDCDEKVQF